jgi:hypothetical protein
MSIALGSLAQARPEFPPKVELGALQEHFAQAKPVHPCLLATAEDLAALRGDKLPPLAAELAEGVVREARAMLEIPPITREQQGRRLLGQSRRCLKRCLYLAASYHLTGEREFVVRAEQEMLAVAAFGDWNPSHYLDVAEMTLGMAIGYDWLYHQLDPAARATIRDAILDKGVRVPWDNPRHAGWSRAGNNWGQVCHAGMVAGALVTWEDDPELAAKTVHRALADVVHSMRAFAPNGSYPEGPGYWNYGTSFNVVLIAALEGMFGSDFGLDRAPGFRKTAEYVPLTYGPSGQFFNYADGGSGRGPQEVMYWFAHRYGRPDWLLHEDTVLRSRLPRLGDARTAASDSDRLLPLALLWMQPEPAADIRMPLHWSSGGHVPITIHRSSWTDPRATFLGVKAGSPSAPHGHMDTGSFVLDADGVRWALDLGAESYHGIESRGLNLWNSAQESDRWKVFRLSSLSHNTLVIDGALQNVKGKGTIVQFSDRADFPHTVVDLSEVYPGQVEKARRGFALLPSGEVLVQDHLFGGKPATTVRWGFVTRGIPGEDLTGAAVILRDGEQTLRVTRMAPKGIAWQVYNTAEPPNEWDSPNRNTRMLGFEAVFPASGELHLGVVFTPGSRVAEAKAAELPFRALDSW